MNVFNSITYKDSEVREFESLFKHRRSGLLINSREEGVTPYFKDFNEAITTMLEIKFDQEFSEQIPALQPLVNLRKIVIDQYIKEEAFSIEEGQNIQDVQSISDTDSRFKVIYYPYIEERKKLQLLFKSLFERNQDTFSSEDDVFNMFAKAAFSGKLLEIARLIESTYGEGSFAEIAKGNIDMVN